jgi:hypothetical protein
VIYLVCTACETALRISPGEEGEVEALLSEELKCWECRAPLEHLTHVQPQAAAKLNCHDVTPREAYAVLYGLGLPSEQDCSAAAVSVLLEQHHVVKAHTTQIRGSHRCVIEHIDLDDGTRVYFGASAHGATVYRVAKRHSYVEANDAGT